MEATMMFLDCPAYLDRSGTACLWPGAPLRNRTVDLLLTMETLCRLS
jgi:hypothetical protein